MITNNYKIFRKGKVKDIYEVDNDTLLFHFTNRISAFDVILSSIIPQKGEVLCKFAEFWFQTLDIPNHMLKVIGKDKILVKRLEIIPIECVVRGYLYGSYYERAIKGEVNLMCEPILASKLKQPVFDPTTKFEDKDRPIRSKEIIANQWLTNEEFNLLKKYSIKLYLQMSKVVEKVGFIIADVKFEFGKDRTGTIILGDSLGPDEFRLWKKDQYKEGKSQEPYDKQLVRDWLINVGYKKKLEEARVNYMKDPPSPKLPDELISAVLERYVYSYEKITGRKFD